MKRTLRPLPGPTRTMISSKPSRFGPPRRRRSGEGRRRSRRRGCRRRAPGRAGRGGGRHRRRRSSCSARAHRNSRRCWLVIRRSIRISTCDATPRARCPVDGGPQRGSRATEVAAVRLGVDVPAAHDRDVRGLGSVVRPSRAAVEGHARRPRGRRTARRRGGWLRRQADRGRDLGSVTVTTRRAGPQMPERPSRGPGCGSRRRSSRLTSSAGQRTMSPRSGDSRASAASSGSTPMTRASGRAPSRPSRPRSPVRRRRSGRGRREVRRSSTISRPRCPGRR